MCDKRGREYGEIPDRRGEVIMKSTNENMKQFNVAAAVVTAALLTFASAIPGFAQGEDGGTQSPFSLGAGARGISLGRSFVSLADDASAMYWNPAALRNVEQTQVMGMYMSLFGDFTGADYTYLGAVYPTLGAGAFGIGFLRVGTTFDGYDALSRPIGEGEYSESQLIIGYAAERYSRWVGGRLAVGSSFKVSRQVIDPFSSTAPGADLGFRYIPDMAKSIAIGLNFQDFAGGEHKLNQEGDPALSTVMLGAGYTRHFSSGSALRMLVQMDLPEAADSKLHLGMEYAFANYMAIRAGMDDGDVSFGLGLEVRGYGFDYAFLTRDEAGSAHPVAFTARMGTSLPDQKLALEREREQEAQALVRRAFEARVTRHRDAAESFSAQGDFESALDEWQIVLEFAPDDADALAKADEVRNQILARQAALVRDAGNQAIVRTRFAQGLDFFNSGNLVRARGEWQAILAIDSLHAGARDYLGRTQLRIDEAVEGHIAHAGELERSGRLTEAIAEWNNVQQYEPDSAAARNAVARIRRQIESTGQDLRAAQRRLSAVSLYEDGLRLYNEGKYAEAVDKFDALLRIQPDHADGKRQRALAKRRLTPLTPEEKAQIRQLYLAGMRLFSQDEYAKAIVEWEKILEIDPGNESVRRNIEEAKGRLESLDNGD